MGNPRILIVEDETKVANSIKRGLEDMLYEAEVAYDGFVGKQMALQSHYDLIILDVNLPQMNGFELCKEIRSHNSRVPIIMLTALSSTDNKVKGFESGADDYMVKPFEFRELLVRVKALLKRVHAEGESYHIVLKIADLEVNLDTKTVKRDNKKIELTAKEFLLLEYLIKNKGRVISKVDIAEKIWDLTFDTGTNIIEVYVNFLRKKIDKGFSQKLIHTHVGLGYVLKEEDN